MTDDPALEQATAQVGRVISGGAPAPVVRSFFDPATFTASHVVHDPATRAAAVVDSVMDFDAASGRTSFASAQGIVDHVRGAGLTVAWHLETHAHADHLSAAAWLKAELGGAVAIGSGIRAVQAAFCDLLGEGQEFARDGSGFDRLLDDGEGFAVGGLEAVALHVPGHTPSDAAYVIGDAAFVGDTIFMPDYGSARCDFPGGDARALYRSVRRLLSLPDATRLFLCHDYKAPGRDAFAWETNVGAQRAGNVHIRDGVSEDEFAAMREGRDATLAMPKLMWPAIQVNLSAGRLPEPDADGVRCLKLPLNRL
jgi:glyoxylase-like metal-dependent hydrolase (beta-lactamase superfamily II)